MSAVKRLAVFGTILAVGAVSAALALAYASEASEVRARLRGLYRGLKSRVWPDAVPAREEAAPPTATDHHADAAVRVEHAIEHGAEGRAQARDRARKPHVRA